MKKMFRLAATVLFLLSMIGTVWGCAALCTPPPGTDTGDIGWKLGENLYPILAGMLLLSESMFYSCVMYFFLDRKKWNIPLTVLMSLLLLGLLAFFLVMFGSILFPSLYWEIKGACPFL